MRVVAVMMLAAWLLPMPALAQNSERDRGILQAFLEDNLSATGRDIRIVGFSGALSGRATIDELTIADSEGVWLTLRGAVLDWNRGALLAGRLEVAELSAEALIIPRAPIADPEAPAPAASGSAFSLPDLPVAINIGNLALDRVELGADLLGQDAVMRLAGTGQLSGGSGTAELSLERIDDRQGEIALTGSYDNASRDLALDLRVEEGEDGIVANLLDLPGQPAILLQVTGNDPIDDFQADIRLATDGEDRLAGTVTLATETDEDGTTRRVNADVGGDIAPVFAPQYRPFFGPDIALSLRAATFPDGEQVLESLDLRARSITLTGSGAIGADGWPRLLDLTGQIVDPDGDPVRVPLGEGGTELASADLSLQYDRAADDAWEFRTEARQVVQADGTALDSLALNAGGRIIIPQGTDDGAVDGQLQVSVDGIYLPDPRLSTAVGDALSGRMAFDWTDGSPLRLSEIDLSGADYGLTGAVTLDQPEEGLDLLADVDMTLAAQDLSRFAPLAGVPLTGAARLAVTGDLAPVSGLVDLRFDGGTTDLALDQPQVDPLLAGEGQLSLRVVRGTTGTRVEGLRIATDHATITGDAELREEDVEFGLDTRVDDVALVAPELQGPATLTAQGSGTYATVDLIAEASLPGQAALNWQGQLSDLDSAPRLAGEARVQLGALSDFSSLVGRDLGGAITARADVALALSDMTGRVDLEADTTDLALDQPQVDPLLAGNGRLEARVQRDASGVQVDRLNITTDHATITGDGRVGDEGGSFDLNARLAEVSMVAPGLEGPASLTAQGSGTDTEWDLTADATLPGQTEVNWQGRLTDLDSAAQLAGQLRAQVGALSAYSTLAGRRLGGSIAADADISLAIEELAGSVDLTLRTQSPSINLPIADSILRGEGQLTTRVTRNAEGRVTVENARLSLPELSGQVDGTSGPQGDSLTASLRLRNGGLLAPELSGPVTIEGTARRDNGTWRVDVDGTASGGTTLATSGTLAADFSRADLALNGRVPLALANARLSPRAVNGIATYDLRLSGPLALSSLSGRIETSDARFALPNLALALEAINARIDLSGGQARIEAGTNVSSGGRLQVTGTTGLSAPFNADLAVQAQNLGLRQARLFETTADGTITLRGPLTGGARIAGVIDLGPAELRIPASSGASFADLPGLRHVNEPAEVRRVRQWAGLVEQPGDGRRAARGPAFPIDLTIRAPSRIFVRGRGLDAELGGQLRLLGTTADLVPQGRFELVRGRFDILGQRLVLDEGFVNLQGSFDPYLRFSATTQTTNASVTLGLEGLASAPELLLSSVPSLPEDEILSLLLFGRDLTEISPLQALRLANALRTLSGRGGAGLTGQLRESLSLDDLDVSTDADGTVQARAGKYLSENIYSDVVVNGTGETEINLNLEVSPSVTVRGRLRSDGDTGIGVYFERDY
ncbi:translocation/assembly module TamB domain-containing protein [Lacimonas salitolerans]|uniref:Translocation/assembly module TamB domain-containing protein n=1 Tax=Lacimonas salitolerans TaxID=1323750 RepID=A0ABW4E9V3_9RHOB